jgi:transcriptional regulator with XRE-family HTH domain
MDNKKLLEIFGFNLKIERIKNKLSQEELALKSGFSKPYISNVECAKHNISLINAYKLSEVLNKSLDEMLKEQK